jgi:hypothetical protein
MVWLSRRDGSGRGRGAGEELSGRPASLENVEEGTRLTNSVELQPRSIISRFMVPLAASQIEASVASNLNMLRLILEDS